MTTTKVVKRKGIWAMLGAFLILAVAFLTTPFMQKAKKTAPSSNEVVIISKRSPFKALAMFGIASAGMLSLLASQTQAATIDLNSTLGPIMDSVANLMPSIVNMILAVVPAMLVLTVVGFLVAFFDRILAMMHLK